MSKIIIAIDGYSSCGKSTLAKELARELRYVYIDTGAMYRAVALYAIRNNFLSEDSFNVEGLIGALSKIRVSFSYNASVGTSETYLNDENVEKEIRGMKVSNVVSKVAQVKEVRKKLVEIQKEMGKEKGLIMDGRDIGTAVFPEAELKLFMTADVSIRAKRRFDELKNKGIETTMDEVFRNINLRDGQDVSRTENPLIKAEDAIEIDNSTISPAQQLKLVMSYVMEKQNKE